MSEIEIPRWKKAIYVLAIGTLLVMASFFPTGPVSTNEPCQATMGLLIHNPFDYAVNVEVNHSYWGFTEEIEIPANDNRTTLKIFTTGDVLLVSFWTILGYGERVNDRVFVSCQVEVPYAYPLDIYQGYWVYDLGTMNLRSFDNEG